MGAVFLAEHALIGKQAAIKVLLPAASAAPDAVQRFFTEARAAARIRHPGMIEVFDYGTDRAGHPYLVMEYLAGESLASRLRRDGRLAPALAIELARQVAAVVAAAHDANIVHRDLKPGN